MYVCLYVKTSKMLIICNRDNISLNQATVLRHLVQRRVRQLSKICVKFDALRDN